MEDFLHQNTLRNLWLWNQQAILQMLSGMADTQAVFQRASTHWKSRTAGHPLLSHMLQATGFPTSPLDMLPRGCNPCRAPLQTAYLPHLQQGYHSTWPLSPHTKSLSSSPQPGGYKTCTAMALQLTPPVGFLPGITASPLVTSIIPLHQQLAAVTAHAVEGTVIHLRLVRPLCTPKSCA